jgi:hypothetical protein
LTSTKFLTEISLPSVRSITKKNPFLGAWSTTLRSLPPILRSARIIGWVDV